MFGAVKVTNAIFYENKYFGYGIGFGAGGVAWLSDRSRFGKNVVMFGADMSLSGMLITEKRYTNSW